MFDEIQISDRSQALINSYIDACRLDKFKIQPNDLIIEYDVLVDWLSNKFTVDQRCQHNSSKEIEFVLVSLQAELLADLNLYLSAKKLKYKKQPEIVPVSAKIKFALFVVSGALFAACEGFDSITTMLGMLSLTSWIVLATGLIFAILSVVVFYGLNLMQISQQLGIRWRDAPKLINAYSAQLNEIKSIRQEINSFILSELDIRALNHLNKTLNMLQNRLEILNDSSKQFELALNSKKIHIAKMLFSGTAGLMCFGAGFFAGQSVAALIFGLFSLAITPAIWPIILFSFVVGAAAFNIYWFNDRDNLKKLISSWLGMDEDKIERLSDKAQLTKELGKIDVLMRKIKGELKLMDGLSSSQKMERQPENTIATAPIFKTSVSPQTVATKSSLYAFFSKAWVKQKDFTVTSLRCEF